ncbi:hypothetical protein OsJ_19491 [Oryza sativa Japonica Group]|uniref:Uncharacterized protein n=1 Tax=Oryza sativa subsp. japonica TaxID=39947 RepID=B9FHW2_ORYSJ|nr:hypothetical protein OsJ_19491 [Oryza sativa Japonica Group]
MLIIGGVSPDQRKLASEGLQRSGEPSSPGDDRESWPCRSADGPSLRKPRGSDSDPTVREEQDLSRLRMMAARLRGKLREVIAPWAPVPPKVTGLRSPEGFPKSGRRAPEATLGRGSSEGPLKPDMPAGADHISCALTRQAKNQALVDTRSV